MKNQSSSVKTIQLSGHEEEVEIIKYLINNTLDRTLIIAEQFKSVFPIEKQAEAIFDLIVKSLPYKKQYQEPRTLKLPSRILGEMKIGEPTREVTDFTIIISSILKRLNIHHFLRVVEYDNKGFFQHIYPVIPLNDDFYRGSTNRTNYLVLDAVKGEFNSEEPFTKFLDYSL